MTKNNKKMLTFGAMVDRMRQRCRQEALAKCRLWAMQDRLALANRNISDLTKAKLVSAIEFSSRSKIRESVGRLKSLSTNMAQISRLEAANHESIIRQAASTLVNSQCMKMMACWSILRRSTMKSSVRRSIIKRLLIRLAMVSASKSKLCWYALAGNRVAIDRKTQVLENRQKRVKRATTDMIRCLQAKCQKGLELLVNSSSCRSRRLATILSKLRSATFSKMIISLRKLEVAASKLFTVESVAINVQNRRHFAMSMLSDKLNAKMWKALQAMVYHCNKSTLDLVAADRCRMLKSAMIGRLFFTSIGKMSVSFRYLTDVSRFEVSRSMSDAILRSKLELAVARLDRYKQRQCRMIIRRCVEVSHLRSIDELSRVVTECKRAASIRRLLASTVVKIRRCFHKLLDNFHLECSAQKATRNLLSRVVQASNRKMIVSLHQLTTRQLACKLTSLSLHRLEDCFEKIRLLQVKTFFQVIENAARRQKSILALSRLVDRSIRRDFMQSTRHCLVLKTRAERSLWIIVKTVDRRKKDWIIEAFNNVRLAGLKKKIILGAALSLSRLFEAPIVCAWRQLETNCLLEHRKEAEDKYERESKVQVFFWRFEHRTNAKLLQALQRMIQDSRMKAEAQRFKSRQICAELKHSFLDKQFIALKSLRLQRKVPTMTDFSNDAVPEPINNVILEPFFTTSLNEFSHHFKAAELEEEVKIEDRSIGITDTPKRRDTGSLTDRGLSSKIDSGRLAASRGLQGDDEETYCFTERILDDRSSKKKNIVSPTANVKATTLDSRKPHHQHQATMMSESSRVTGDGRLASIGESSVNKNESKMAMAMMLWRCIIESKVSDRKTEVLREAFSAINFEADSTRLRAIATSIDRLQDKIRSNYADAREELASISAIGACESVIAKRQALKDAILSDILSRMVAAVESRKRQAMSEGLRAVTLSKDTTD